MSEVREYSYGAYNKHDDIEQWIRLSEGCPHNCEYCYEPTEIKLFNIPEIIRNKVKIMDMNLLAKKEALSYIKELGSKTVNGKVVYYELICGIDYRFLTQGIANTLKEARFKHVRLAWDWYINDQIKVKEAIKMLIRAGYKTKELMLFMVCNWKIDYLECLKKLDMCKYWQIQISDCYFNNQLPPNVKPVYWKYEEIKSFRKQVRKHNQIVRSMIDPEMEKTARLF